MKDIELEFTKKGKLKKKIFPLSISPEVIDSIDQLANTNSRSRSGQVELILKSYLKTKKSAINV